MKQLKQAELGARIKAINKSACIRKTLFFDEGKVCSWSYDIFMSAITKWKIIIEKVLRFLTITAARSLSTKLLKISSLNAAIWKMIQHFTQISQYSYYSDVSEFVHTNISEFVHNSCFSIFAKRPFLEVRIPFFVAPYCCQQIAESSRGGEWNCYVIGKWPGWYARFKMTAPGRDNLKGRQALYFLLSNSG